MEQDYSFSWAAPEYSAKKNTPDWYWAVSIICIALSVISFLLKDYLFAIFVIASCGLIFYFSSRPGKIIDHKVDANGIQVGAIFYPYKNIIRFSMDQRPEETRLYIQLHQGILPIRHMIVSEDIDSDDLADYMSEFVPEESFEEPKVVQILERLGF